MVRTYSTVEQEGQKLTRKKMLRDARRIVKRMQDNDSDSEHTFRKFKKVQF